MIPLKHLRVSASKTAPLHIPYSCPRRSLPCIVLQSFRRNSSGPNRPKASSPRKKVPDKINYNPDNFFDTPDPEHATYKRVTANELATHSEPPTRVKMLIRDFIEDSLYNPNYGYFPKQVNIFTAQETIEFSSIRNVVQFQEEVAKRYAQYGLDEAGPGRQIWHTPTELFKVCGVVILAENLDELT